MLIHEEGVCSVQNFLKVVDNIRRHVIAYVIHQPNIPALAFAYDNHYFKVSVVEIVNISVAY